MKTTPIADIRNNMTSNLEAEETARQLVLTLIASLSFLLGIWAGNFRFAAQALLFACMSNVVMAVGYTWFTRSTHRPAPRRLVDASVPMAIAFAIGAAYVGLKTIRPANTDNDAYSAAAAGGEAKAIAAFRAWREAGAAGADETAPGALPRLRGDKADIVSTTAHQFPLVTVPKTGWVILARSQDGRYFQVRAAVVGPPYAMTIGGLQARSVESVSAELVAAKRPELLKKFKLPFSPS